jgi:hypothetical protein
MITGLPESDRVDQLGLEEADHGLGEGIDIGVADGADRRRDTDGGEAFGERDGGVLGRRRSDAPAGQAVDALAATRPDCLSERVEHGLGAHAHRRRQPRMRRA